MNVLGLGVDIVEIARIESSIARHGEPFLRRVFTDAEREYCAKMSAPAPFYAARWAAKEAVSKAFATGIGAEFGWLDLEVCRRPSGAPFLLLHRGAAAYAERLGIREILLSLSHSEHYAVANAIALGGLPL